MKKISLTIITSLVILSSPAIAETFTGALTGGKANADLRLRYETVEQNNLLKDASALTLRTRLGYTTGSYKGFSAKVEMEDVRIVGGVDDYSVPPTGFKTGVYSVIADPENTEVDQGYIKYNNESISAILGRQVITYDNQRFVGHVGWRQDRQTFDGFRFDYTPIKDLTFDYAYVTKRNRIFAEAADLYSKDHMLNIDYNTPIGKLTGYGYLLEVDNNTDNSLDSYGLRFKGSRTVGSTKLLYTAEYATQESKKGTTKFDADYMFLEGGVAVSGITAKVGYEVLGSDKGNYGFSTPLATLHKFNGWADVFLATPNQGLTDLYVSLGSKLGKGKLIAVYHDFNADESTPGVDDLGSEIDLAYVMKFTKVYNGGIKYSTYSAGDASSGKVDTDKLWVWAGLKF